MDRHWTSHSTDVSNVLAITGPRGSGNARKVSDMPSQSSSSRSLSFVDHDTDWRTQYVQFLRNNALTDGQKEGKKLQKHAKGFKRKRVCLERSDSHSTKKKGFERSEKLDFGKQFDNNLEFLLYLMMLNRSSSSFSFSFSSDVNCDSSFIVASCLLCSTLAQGF